MKAYFESNLVKIYHGDCREVMAELPPESIDTVLTDPPYGLSFMGRAWDHGVPGPEFWEIALNVCKPGAMLLAFGGTRTHHRLMCAIEDAGWEIRDCLMWLYGTGFPKSYDVSKGIDKALGAEREKVQPGNAPAYQRGIGNTRPWMDDADHKIDSDEPVTDEAKLWSGWGSGMKPSWEPVILSMKALDGGYARNALEHGVAGLNIDGSRIGGEARINNEASRTSIWGKSESNKRKGCPEKLVTGRFPANLLLDEAAAAMLDEQAQQTVSKPRTVSDGPKFGFGGGWNPDTVRNYNHTDSGGPSRFFYTSKASVAERGVGNIHPTVKPLDLMKWLANLTATPTGGLVLDPFMGSGSTLVAARDVGRPVIGIETEEEYCEIAAKRLAQDVLDFEAVEEPKDTTL